ncbi:bud neck involved protein [Podila humilis]|nr:bud neck involved protein [Podila humilis]
MMTNSPTFTSTPVRPASVTRLSSDQQSIHPLQVDSIDTSSDLSSSSVPTATDKTQTYLAANIQPVAFTEQPVVRKKTSFASKLRKVFIAKQAVCNNTSNSSHPTNGQVSCMPPPEIRFSQRRDSTESSSMVIDQEHRGSVSSASSMNSAERRGSTQSQSSITPSTSPDMSPIVHSKPHMHAMEPPSAESQSMFGAGMTSATSHDSGIDGPSDSSAQESATSSSSESDSKPSALTLPPTQTRTVKKRLSFASISSFFSPKSNQDQETRAKQQRSSSVPHVENPLISVGRQIASFQRRHSLNDMQEAKKKQQQPLEQSPKVSATSWNKDGTAVSTAEETCAVEDSGDSNPSQTKATNSISATKSKLRLNNVFGKGKKKKAHLTKGGPKLENLAPAKPLRPALVHRSPTQQPQGNAKVHRVGSRRRSSSVRSNQSNRSIRQRNHQRRNSHSEEAGSESNASASGSSTGSSSNSASTGRASLSRKSLEEHQARINSLPPTEQQPHYNQHRHRASRKHRRQGSQASQASLENDRQYQYQQQQQQQQYSSFNSASDCQEHCSSPAEFSHVENGAFASPMCPIKNGQEPTREGALASAPTAIMLPLTSSETSTTTSSSLDLNNSKRPHHVLRNPLSSLSPSSSCCSFASDIEEEDEEDETRGAMHGSSHDRYSSSSTSSSSVQSNGSDRHDRRRTQQQQHQMDHGGDEICEEPQQQAYNPLLPAAAARISVDRIMMENAPAFQPKVEVPASANMYIHPGQEVQCLQEHTLLTSTTSNQQQQQQQQQCLYMQEPDHPHHHQQYYHPDPSTYPPRPPRQLQFSTLDPSIHPTWTAVEYDRTSDANITALRLTPAIAHKIKLELNQFKSQEMEVHEESRVYTHFFV